MNPQYSPFDRQPEDRGLEDLVSRTGASMQRFEIALRASDSRVYKSVATELIQSPESYSLMVPRIIEVLTDPHPRTAARAAELLLARPHWIGIEPLNELLFPRLCQEISNPDTWVPVTELLLALAPCASEFDDQHISRYFGMSQASMIGAPASQQQLALFSFFGERIPERMMPRVLLSLAEAVEVMNLTIATDPVVAIEPTVLCQPAISGLYVLRHHIRESIDRDAEPSNLETFLVQSIERYISCFASFVEAGQIPTRVEQYQLLLTYPLINAGSGDEATEYNLDRIQRVLPQISPSISELLYRSRDPDLKGIVLDRFVNLTSPVSAAEFDLMLLASLMLTARNFEPGATYSRASRTDAARVQDLLEQLSPRVVNPFIFPIYSSCFKVVEQGQ